MSVIHHAEWRKMNGMGKKYGKRTTEMNEIVGRRGEHTDFRSPKNVENLRLSSPASAARPAAVASAESPPRKTFSLSSS